MRRLERPDEGHALRSMTLEEIEAAREHCRNGLKQARDQQNLRLARIYSRQNDRIAAELMSRRMQRGLDDEHARTSDDGWPKELL